MSGAGMAASSDGFFGDRFLRQVDLCWNKDVDVLSPSVTCSY